MEGNKLSLHILGLKAKIKNELYRLLTTEANLYLSPQRETSIYFVRDIIHGRKRVISCKSNHNIGFFYGRN